MLQKEGGQVSGMMSLGRQERWGASEYVQEGGLARNSGKGTAQ